MRDKLGDRLRKARAARGLSLRSVAQSIGVSTSLVSQIETGKTLPSVSILYGPASLLLLLDNRGVSGEELHVNRGTFAV